jgi:Domain of unknown function (DUF1992)
MSTLRVVCRHTTGCFCPTRQYRHQQPAISSVLARKRASCYHTSAKQQQSPNRLADDSVGTSDQNSGFHEAELVTKDTTETRPVSNVGATTAATAGPAEDKNDAFTRRMEQLASDAIESSPRSAAKLLDDQTSSTGFDEGLKKQLEERILGANLSQVNNPQAFAFAGLSSNAGRGTRDIAGSPAWTGEESLEDATLRMLVDVRRPLRSPRSAGGKFVPPRVIAPKPVSSGVKTGTRLAEARDRSTAYTALRDNGMTKEERDAYFREVKERFQPAARDLPATLTGLASLANERIEEAMARGQFKNLPRGKKLERDHNSGNPFLDTTEYIMNNMIKKQDIVPPWIEKQQEVALAAHRFRSRLRQDWTRHAARLIASKGGTLQQQMQRANEYAVAEQLENPAPMQPSATSATITIDHLSQISLAGEISAPALNSAEDSDKNAAVLASTTSTDTTTTAPAKIRPAFRDPDWESTELSFHKLSVDSLNSQTRSYNLMAPRPAQKPYFNLQRELNACYREVAPHLATEIRERALAPKKAMQYKLGGNGPTSILDAVARSKAPVHDEDLGKKGYGFRQFWRDLFTDDDRRRV